MAEKKNDLMEWLGFTNPPKFVNAPWVGKILGFLISALCFALIGLMLLILAKFTAAAISGNFTENGDEARALRELGTVILALFGAPFLIWRTLIASKQAHTAHESHVTDQISKAVEQIGADKVIKTQDGEESQPNLEVRVGGLLSLERIAQYNLADHIQVMEIICAYIRETSRTLDYSTLFSLPEGYFEPRIDIKTALDILGRRGSAQLALEEREGFRPNLRYAKFNHQNLHHVNLSFVDLSYAEFYEANLYSACLESASLISADFRGTFLQDCHLVGAILFDTILSPTTAVTGAEFAWAAFAPRDYNTFQITQQQIDVTYGHAKLSLQQRQGNRFGGIQFTPPLFWHEDSLEWKDFQTAWKAWKAKNGFDRENLEGGT